MLTDCLFLMTFQNISTGGCFGIPLIFNLGSPLNLGLEGALSQAKMAGREAFCFYVLLLDVLGMPCTFNQPDPGHR